MIKEVYLDNSATTKVCETAIENINTALRENWGNPSSLHEKGVRAEIELEDCRKEIAKRLSSRPDEVYFVSGGTEANNTAVFGAAQKNRKRGKTIVTTSIEHPSVLEPIKRLEEKGFKVIYLDPMPDGSIKKEDIFAAVNEDTVLVSMMLVNNETGAVQPVECIREAVRKSGSSAIIHCDAVQAFGKVKTDVETLGVDLMSISGHKIHGPKGVGALYIRKGVNIPAFILGGGQEKGMRSGTESVPLISGLKGAVNELGDINKNLQKVREVRDYALSLFSTDERITVNSADACIPYILNVSLEGYRSETMMHFLESKGVFVSSGSACSKGKGSYVLSKMGLKDSLVDSALRISMSRFTEKEDIDLLFEAIISGMDKLKRVK